MFRNPVICEACYQELSPRFTHFKANGVQVVAIYPYDEKVRSLLYQFKGCFDYELKEAFLDWPSSLLRLRYLGYEIVPVPSSSVQDEKRGFNHVVEMFSSLKLPYIHALKKTSDEKQASLNFEERQSVKDRLSYVGPPSLKGKKILLVDDVYTTGATIKASLALLREHHPKRIEALVMAKVEKPDGNG